MPKGRVVLVPWDAANRHIGGEKLVGIVGSKGLHERNQRKATSDVGGWMHLCSASQRMHGSGTVQSLKQVASNAAGTVNRAMLQSPPNAFKYNADAYWAALSHERLEGKQKTARLSAREGVSMQEGESVV